MQHYRLLRNNKESGPYTWQELRDLPLKAYDLVWSEGRSAAWRYPSELEEFKGFAPPVTEDLYTQFHTPPSSWQREENTPTRTATVKKIPHKKYVSVILPRPADKIIEIKEPVQATAFNGIGIVKEEAFITEDQLNKTSSRTARPQKKTNPYLVTGTVLVLLAAALFFYRNNLPLPGRSSAPELQKPAEMATLTGAKQPELKPNSALDFASLKRHLSVSAGDFSVGFFGGISKLDLTVTNTGKTPLENIRIAVDFLKKDKSVVGTEMISIPYLDANASLTEKISGNRQGFAIRTRITSINGLNAP